MSCCAVCGRRKTIGAFYFYKGHRRRDRMCKACRREKVRAAWRRRYYGDLEESRARTRAAATVRRRALGVRAKRVFSSEEARREAYREYSRKWRRLNPARRAEALAAYEQRYPERVKVRRVNLKARRRGATGEITGTQWKAILLFYGNRCAQCRTPATKRPLTADHFAPIRLGGDNTWRNVWPLCLSCNLKKRDGLPATARPPHVEVLARTLEASA